MIMLDSQTSSKVAGAGPLPMQSFLVLFFPFAFFALLSIAYEVWAARKEIAGMEEGPSRDSFWDMSKFVLIVMVFDLHLCFAFPSQIMAPFWDSFFMCAFFLVCGIFTRMSTDVFSWKILSRVLRDCILPQLLLRKLSSFVISDTQIPCLGLWFLTALAVYRICLVPVCTLAVRVFGHWQAAVVCVSAVTLGSMKMFTGGFLVDYYYQVYEAKMLLFQSIFFTAGIFLDSTTLRVFLTRPLVIGCGTLISYLHVCTMLCWTAMAHQPIFRTRLDLAFMDRSLGTVEPQEVLDYPYLFLWSLVLRAILSFATMTWLAPLAIDDSMLSRTLRFTISKMGQRTLYAYVLSWSTLFALIGFGPAVESLGYITGNYGQFAGLVALLLITCVFCSPLIEKCFAWLIQPQWLLDLVISCHDGLTTLRRHTMPGHVRKGAKA